LPLPGGDLVQHDAPLFAGVGDVAAVGQQLQREMDGIAGAYAAFAGNGMSGARSRPIRKDFATKLTPFSKHCSSGSSAKTRSFIRSQKKFDGVVSQPRLR